MKNFRFNTAFLFGLFGLLFLLSGLLRHHNIGESYFNIPYHSHFIVISEFFLFVTASLIFLLFALIYYIFPKIFGFSLNEIIGIFHFVATVISTYILFQLINLVEILKDVSPNIKYLEDLFNDNMKPILIFIISAICLFGINILVSVLNGHKYTSKQKNFLDS